MTRLRTFLEFSGLLLLLICEALVIICVFGLVAQVHGADLSPSVQTFAMCNGRNWGLGCDTSWEATHFDYIFINRQDTNLVNAYHRLNPDVKIIQYSLMPTFIDNETPWDSLTAFFGDSIEKAILHFKNNTLNNTYDYDLGGQKLHMISGWDINNDANSDGVRDFFAYCSLSTSHGADWLIDTTKNWTVNQWSDSGFSIYNYYGGYIGDIDSNTINKLYWTFSGDTTNKISNGDFETGNFSGWDSLEGCADSLEFYIDNIVKHSGTYSAKIKHKCSSSSMPTWLVFKVINPDTLTTYKLSFRYKTTDTLSFHFESWGNGSSYGTRLDSLDGNWHLHSYTFTNNGRDSLQIWIGFQTSYGGYYGDSAWVDDVELISYAGLLTTTEYFAEYPYTIADSHSVNNRSSAMAESLSRVIAESWNTKHKYTMNVGSSGYKNWLVNYWVKLYFSWYPNYNGIMVDNVNNYPTETVNSWLVNEYPSGGVPRDTMWQNDIYEIFANSRDTCQNHGWEFTLNCIPPHDSGMGSNVSGTLDEGAFSPQYFHAQNWDEWRNNNITLGQNARDEGWATISFLDGIGTKQFIMEGYHNHLSVEDTNDLKIASLAHYLCVAGDSTLFQSEWLHGSGLNNWENNLTGQWLNIFSYDIGSPIDTCYQVACDIDADGDSFLVVGRKYARGTDTTLVLFKPAKHISLSTYTPDSTLTAADLPSGHWFELMSNGQFSHNVFSDTKPIYMPYNCGKILIRCSCK